LLTEKASSKSSSSITMLVRINASVCVFDTHYTHHVHIVNCDMVVFWDIFGSLPVENGDQR
jgi:hypothetical protein